MFAFVFPGQGSQSVGMLADLEKEHAIFSEYYDRASTRLGFDLAEIIATDNDSKLNQTAYTQPAILAASCALWQLWCQRQGQKPAIVVGHSLGEYSALVAAESLAFEDAVELVHLRGSLMQSAVAPGEGIMVALVGLDDALVSELCVQIQTLLQDKDVIAPANFNAPGQVVVAGKAVALEILSEKAKEKGAKKVIPLAMSVPSHCSLMTEASEQLRGALAGIHMKDASIPVVQNVDAQLHTKAEELSANLVSQLHSPVLWINSVSTIVSQGVDTVVECGPGKVLQSLVKRIDRDIKLFGLGDSDNFYKTLDGLAS